MFGQDLAAQDRERPLPRATAASTYPRTDCSNVAVRTMRAMSGTWTPRRETSTALLVPAPVIEHEEEEQRRKREEDVGAAHQQGRRASAKYPATRPIKPRPVGDPGRERRAEDAAPTPEDTGRHVAAERSVPRSAARDPNGLPTGFVGEYGAKNGPNNAIPSDDREQGQPDAPMRGGRGDPGGSLPRSHPRPQLGVEQDDERGRRRC